MKTILITGSTGFLGTRLIERLREEEPDSRLRLLTRTGQAPFEGEVIEIVQGNVTDREAFARACQGVEEVYHLTGLVEREPKDPWTQYDIHVEGVRNLCEAMLAAGATR